MPPIREPRTALNAETVAYQPTVAGKTLSRTDIREVLRTEGDRERRRQAWLAFGPLAERIDALLPAEGRKVSHGQAIVAVVLNALGFVSPIPGFAYAAEGITAALNGPASPGLLAWVVETRHMSGTCGVPP